MDEIKRKLTLIEAQMSLRRLCARRIARSPLLIPATGLITGILLQSALRSQHHVAVPGLILWLWITLLGLCSAAICTYAVRAHKTVTPEAVVPGVLLCFVCLGAIRLIAFQTPLPDAIERFVGQERVLATLRGRIVTRPTLERRDWCMADFAFTDPSSSFYMNVEQTQAPQGWVQANGTIRVHVSEPTPNLHRGHVVQVHCWLHRFDAPTNPGQFDVAAYLARRGVHIGATVPSRDAIEVISDTDTSVPDTLRQWLAGAASPALLTDVSSNPSTRGLLEALLLGRREDIDARTYEAFRKTGLLHLISLSGMHLGILVGMVWWLCKLVGLMKPTRAIVCLAATGLFLLIVPARAPTLRAAIIVWTFCLSVLLRRHPDPLNSLCLAGIVLLLIRPTQVFEAGWQLSFAAVVGILLLAHRIEGWIHEATKRRFRSPDHRAHPALRLTQWFADRTIGLFSAGLAAWIAGAGVLLFHFYTITPLASIWTVLVFPLVALILTLGLFKMALFFILPTLSHLLGGILAGATDVLVWVVNTMALPQINTILIGHVTVWVIVFYYASVLLTLYVPIRRPAVKQTLWLVIALSLIAYLGALKWQRTHRSQLDLTCLDVGHGQAIVVRCPGTKTLIFDAGSLHRSNIGTRIVVPFLDYMGIGRIHAIVISHSDIDHINGIPEIAHRRPVDHVYAHETFPRQSAGKGPTERLLECLGRSGHQIESMPETIRTGPTIIRTLWPASNVASPETLTDNDRSMVCAITHGPSTLLLCSDIEQYAQRQILALYPDLTTDLVVVPHHGSTATQDKNFLEKLNPGILLCSRAPKEPPRNGENPPEYPGEQFDTAQNGATTICVLMGTGNMVDMFVYTQKGQLAGE